jgi:hypothetical protein
MRKSNEKTFVFLLLASTLLACGQKHTDSAFQAYMNGIQGTKDYTEIRAKLKDTIQSWKDRELYELLFFKKVKWAVDDAVFFDKNKEKALLLLIVQPKDSLYPADYVKVIGAEKISGDWEFYYASYATIEYYRNRNGHHPYSFVHLSKSGREELIDDGFVTCSLGCSVDLDYVDSDIWFADWRREMHKNFLNGTLPKEPVYKPGQVFE